MKKQIIAVEFQNERFIITNPNLKDIAFRNPMKPENSSLNLCHIILIGKAKVLVPRLQ